MYNVVFTREDGSSFELTARNFQAAVSLIAGVTAAAIEPLSNWSITPIKEESHETEKE